MLLKFLQLAVLGCAFGLFSGFVTHKLLSGVFSDFQVEISLTISLCYLAFYLSDVVIGASGVLTVVFMGLWVSKHRHAVSPAVNFKTIKKKNKNHKKIKNDFYFYFCYLLYI